MSYQLTRNTLSRYLNTDTLKIQECKEIENFQPLLQKNYGEDYDCSLVSITMIINNYRKELVPLDIYKKVEKIAKNYFYNGKVFGTLPFFIKSIFDRSLKEYKIYKTTKAKYLKDCGFTYNLIKENVKAQKPMILSMWNDGRNYYKNHSVVIIGYAIINNKKFLIVFDNWSRERAYIDYSKLNKMSCLN